MFRCPSLVSSSTEASRCFLSVSFVSSLFFSKYVSISRRALDVVTLTRFVGGPASAVDGPASAVDGPASAVDGPASAVDGPHPLPLSRHLENVHTIDFTLATQLSYDIRTQDTYKTHTHTHQTRTHVHTACNHVPPTNTRTCLRAYVRVDCKTKKKP